MDKYLRDIQRLEDRVDMVIKRIDSQLDKLDSLLERLKALERFKEK